MYRIKPEIVIFFHSHIFLLASVHLFLHEFKQREIEWQQLEQGCLLILMERVKVVALRVKKSEYFQVNAFWESVHYQ